MKILHFNTEQEWLDARRGRVTGTKLTDISGSSAYLKSDVLNKLEELKIEHDPKLKKEDLEALLPPKARIALQLQGKKKKGYYELLAERIALPETGELAIDRGKRLEVEAIERFEEEYGKTFNKDLVMWVSDEDESIAFSPDGYDDETEAVEAKCPKSANFLEVLLTGEIPIDYEKQRLQAFIVNSKLQKHHLIYYDPRMPKDMFYMTTKREDIQGEIDEYLELERQVLEEIKSIESELIF